MTFERTRSRRILQAQGAGPRPGEGPFEPSASISLFRVHDLFDRGPERRRVYRGIAVQSWLDRIVVLEQSGSGHKVSRKHGLDVLEVLSVATLDLGERLRDQLEVMKRNPRLSRDEGAAILPAWPYRDEVCRRRELDIDLQSFLDLGNSAEQAVPLGDDLVVKSVRGERQPTNTSVAP